MVAVVGDDFPEEEIEFFRSRRVDTAGLDRQPGRTFRWSGRYAPDFSTRESLDTQLNVFEHFDPQLPEAFRESEIVFLGNIVPALQLKVLDQMTRPELVAADTMNFWISGNRPELLDVLKRVDLLLINDEEAVQLSGEWNLLQAARAVQAMGPRRLVIKRGEHGALLLDGDELFFCPALPLDRVVDPTGAGDSFAGGFLGWLASHGTDSSLRHALVWATAMASIGVEGFGLEQYRNLQAEEVHARVARLRELVAIDAIA
jgi:sugar/nucleoside kinase (ribokinase family)